MESILIKIKALSTCKTKINYGIELRKLIEKEFKIFNFLNSGIFYVNSLTGAIYCHVSDCEANKGGTIQKLADKLGITDKINSTDKSNLRKTVKKEIKENILIALEKIEEKKKTK